MGSMFRRWLKKNSLTRRTCPNPTIKHVLQTNHEDTPYFTISSALRPVEKRQTLLIALQQRLRPLPPRQLRISSCSQIPYLVDHWTSLQAHYLSYQVSVKIWEIFRSVPCLRQENDAAGGVVELQHEAVSIPFSSLQQGPPLLQVIVTPHLPARRRLEVLVRDPIVSYSSP